MTCDADKMMVTFCRDLARLWASYRRDDLAHYWAKRARHYEQLVSRREDKTYDPRVDALGRM